MLYAEPNYIVSTVVIPNDPSYSSLWGMTAIGAPAAWDITTGSAAAGKICIVDTGIDYNHPDLAANMGGTGFNAITNTIGGMDDNSHGSHCGEWRCWLHMRASGWRLQRSASHLQQT